MREGTAGVHREEPYRFPDSGEPEGSVRRTGLLGAEGDGEVGDGTRAGILCDQERFLPDRFPHAPDGHAEGLPHLGSPWGFPCVQGEGGPGDGRGSRLSEAEHGKVRRHDSVHMAGQAPVCGRAGDRKGKGGDGDQAGEHREGFVRDSQGGDAYEPGDEQGGGICSLSTGSAAARKRAAPC